MSVTGKKTGQFQGEGTNAQHADQIRVLAFTMGVTSPRDADTGQATGKRRFQPITIIKEWGAASPQGLEACATNEDLSTVKIEFIKMKATGEEYVSQTVHLTDATIVDISRFIGDAEAAVDLQVGFTDAGGLERWSFMFQKIEVDDADGKTSFVDKW
ncbi:type VI secretion system tube protein Hcp [Paraburkholderia caribensis]|nr:MULTISPECIES: type VI secretion system tube protein Hcp [Paraburkholderia]MCO4882457.1 type VI secretion system tube protein Hcp [Paraburkholderia caribensis]PTB24218.1 type VI secretion system tube protein Hcp [Paraburkholderia caribensis]